MLEIENFLCVKILNVAFILLINLKMPTNDGNLTDGNLTFMGRINLVQFSWIYRAFYNFDTRPAVKKLFSCSTQQSMKFQQLIKTKVQKNLDFS